MKAPQANAREHAGAERDVPRLMPSEQQASDDGNQPHHRADREIDAAGDEHHRHSEPHNGNRREIAGDVGDVVGRPKAWLQKGHEDDKDQECDRNPESLAGDQLLDNRLFSYADHIADRRVAFFQRVSRTMHHGSLP